MKEGKIIRVSGPLVVASQMSGAKMYDVVYVGEEKLMGEVIELKGDIASIQVYEETSGIGVGAPVYPTGAPLSVELGPGLVESIYDGVQRPLNIIREKVGDFITRGVHIPGLSYDKKWQFEPAAKKGDKVVAGDIIGKVQETTILEHRIMVPPDIKEGEIVDIQKGEFTVNDIICKIKTNKGIKNITMLTKWPVRIPRPTKEKLPPEIPMITGQRIIDAFFPVSKGGTACIPGPFGSGKTVFAQQFLQTLTTDKVFAIDPVGTFAKL
jgi:V/A-type H+-transporting ATPase subunit A